MKQFKLIEELLDIYLKSKDTGAKLLSETVQLTSQEIDCADDLTEDG